MGATSMATVNGIEAVAAREAQSRVDLRKKGDNKPEEEPKKAPDSESADSFKPDKEGDVDLILLPNGDVVQVSESDLQNFKNTSFSAFHINEDGTFNFPEGIKNLLAFNTINETNNTRIKIYNDYHYFGYNFILDRASSSSIDALSVSKDVFEAASQFFVKLSSASEIVFIEDEATLPENVVTVVSDNATIYIPVGELVDIEKERARLLKEKEDLEKEVARVQSKLSNQGFIAKAPEKLINEEKEKGVKYQQMLDKVLENLKKL